MRIDTSGKVGIGTTSPIEKLSVAGQVMSSASSHTSSTVGVERAILDLGYAGEARVGHFRGAESAGSGRLTLWSDSVERMRIDSSGDVGIGTTSPSYKLDVNGGGIRAGGKVTYEKYAGSLTTTGYAVAGLISNVDGSSAGFTFTCFGNTGDYQRIVYSCHNVSGTWNTQKVIDEGTNDFDVTASANGSTITFTFKSRSGTKSYTPRVLVEAIGQSINDTYA